MLRNYVKEFSARLKLSCRCRTLSPTQIHVHYKLT